MLVLQEALSGYVELCVWNGELHRCCVVEEIRGDGGG